MDEHMNIVVGSSKELAVFSMVTLKSLFVNNIGEAFNVWFYYHEPMNEIINEIEKLVSESGSIFHPMFVNKEINNRFSVGDMNWWHTSIWYRYLCVDDLYGSCDRVLILGNDVVVQKRIREFYEEDLGGKSIKAVVDMGYFNKFPTEWHEKYGIDRDGYVNTDVVLIDLKRAKGILSAEGMFDNYVDKHLWALDQDVINVCYRSELFVCKNMYFNYIPAEADKAIPDNDGNRKIDDAVFLHFAVSKPWNEYVEKHHHKIWFEYVNRLSNSKKFYFEVLKHMGTYIAKEKENNQEVMSKKNAYIYKMDKLYWVYDKFFSACMEGRFKSNIESLRADRIAVYGYGILGKQFLKYAQKNDIEINCFIDKSESKNENISIKCVEKLSEDDYWDVIIVTPIYDYDYIQNAIKGYCKRVVSFEELV